MTEHSRTNVAFKNIEVALLCVSKNIAVSLLCVSKNSVTLVLVRSKFFLPSLPPHGATAPNGPGPYRDFTITLRHTTLGRPSLDRWSARRRDLYPTTPNTHKRHNPSQVRGQWDRFSSNLLKLFHSINGKLAGNGCVALTEFMWLRIQVRGSEL